MINAVLIDDEPKNVKVLKGMLEEFCPALHPDAEVRSLGASYRQVVEILKTLHGMKESSQFYIIFFNATDIPMPYPSWLSASARSLPG